MRAFYCVRSFKLFLLCIGLFFCGFSSKAQSSFYDIDQVQEIRITFTQSNWRHILDSLFLNYGELGRLSATVSINGKEFRYAGVRFKGNSSHSEGQLKNPFNIDLDYGIKDQNYQGFTKIKLSNVIDDPSFIREVLSYEMARQYMPASRANFANVYVNDTLVGLYTNVEAVDKKFIGRHFSTSEGAFFKGDPAAIVENPLAQYSNLAYNHGSDSSGYMAYYAMESDLGWNKLFQLIDVLNNDTANISDVLNVDRALWMHAFNYSLINLDSYIGFAQNFYIYRDGNGRFNTIPWDFNMSFGSFRITDDISLSLTIDKVKQLDPLQHLNRPALTPRPLMKNLFRNTTYRKMYIAHLRTIIKEQFESGSYMDRALHIQSVIDDDVVADTNRFYSYTDFINNLTVTTGLSSDLYPGIQDLMVSRMAYLDTFPGFRGAPEILLQPANPGRPVLPGSCSLSCKVTGASTVFVFSRFTGEGLFTMTPMFDDGAHGDGLAGDSIYGASVSGNGDILQYYFYAENDSAGQFLPERAQYEFFTVYPVVKPEHLVINEVNVVAGTRAEDGEAMRTSWVELFNNTDEPLKLDGLSLHSGSEPTHDWALPDTLLNAHAYLVIGLNGVGPQYSLSLDISLPAEGGSLYLSYAADNSIIDSVSYGLQTAYKSYGSYPNGSNNRRYLWPTMRGCNQADYSNAVTFHAFPVPAQNVLYIEASRGANLSSVEIYNSNMQKMWSAEAPFDAGFPENGLLEINTTSFNEGLYFVKLAGEDLSEIIKIIIIR